MWNCTHFRHPTDEQMQNRYIFLATTIICSLSALNSKSKKSLRAAETKQILFVAIITSGPTRQRIKRKGKMQFLFWRHKTVDWVTGLGSTVLRLLPESRIIKCIKIIWNSNLGLWFISILIPRKTQNWKRENVLNFNTFRGFRGILKV